MIEWIPNILNAGATGVAVSIVLAIESYLRDRRGAAEEASIQDYLEWLRRQDHQELLGGQSILLDRLKEGGEESEAIIAHLERILQAVQDVGDRFSAIRTQIDLIPEIDRKLELLNARLPGATPNQLLIDAKVLEVLASGLKGAGVRVVVRGPRNIHEAGTLLVVWRLGSQSPSLMLADYIGGIHENRLSLILNTDGSITLRVYDGAGSKIEMRSPSHIRSEYLIAAAIWHGRELRLWTNNVCDGTAYMEAPFHCLGPTVLFGIDIEGTFSAHAVRWSTSGLRMGMSFRYGSLNLQKDSIWHGSRHDIQLIVSSVLTASQIQYLSCYPWAMWKRIVDFDKTNQDLTNAIAENFFDVPLRIERGLLFSWRDDFERAILDFDEAIRIDPTMIEAHFFRGLMNNMLGNIEQAVIDLRRAECIDPRNTDVHCRLAWIFAASPNPAHRSATDALEHSHKAYTLGSWRPDVLDVFAASCAEAGDFRDAAKHQELALMRCLGEFRDSFLDRLNSYRKSIPFRDYSWAWLRTAYRHGQMSEIRE